MLQPRLLATIFGAIALGQRQTSLSGITHPELERDTGNQHSGMTGWSATEGRSPELESNERSEPVAGARHRELAWCRDAVAEAEGWS